MSIILANIILIPYRVYKKKTGKTIDWVEHGVFDKDELYLLVKEKKYNDTLNCKIKQVSKFEKIIFETVESIEGIKM